MFWRILFFVTAKIEIGEDPATTLGNREDSEENEMEEMLEELFAAIMTVTDPAGKYIRYQSSKYENGF